MPRRVLSFILCGFTILLCGLPTSGMAQFSGNVSGVLSDPSGAVVPRVALTLTNRATEEKRTATSTDGGVYQFVSLAPGDYELESTVAGFNAVRTSLTLGTNQNLSLPITLTVGGSTTQVDVNTQAAVLDIGETRQQETLSTETLSSLPLAGRNMISLVTLAPGVTGTGVTGNGSPGSGRDNFSTETQVDASANGMGAVGNMYIVDGLDVSSSIRPGVLNMTPNPDSIQETTIQTNTYNVDYGRSSSIQMTMTTKSGGNRYHGNASDYFNYQGFFAGTEFTRKYTPFHSNNISATIGGPIVPQHNGGFFFFAIEPLRSSTAVSSNITFEDPAFTAFAKATFPNSLGTKLLSTYPVTKVSNVQVASTAASVFPATGATACGTAATAFLPCDTAVLDSGNYTDTAFRNGLQYSIRLDKSFKSERLYGAYYRTTLDNNSTNPRSAFASTSNYAQYAIQINETHTFNPTTLNEASFAAMRVEGVLNATGLFTVPVVNVTGLGQGFGTGFAQGDFIQHNYHWRDVLTHTFKSHDVKLGYEGLFADDVELFDGPYDQPTFNFNSLLELAKDNVYTQTGLSYDPQSGQRTQYNWDAAGVTHGAFVEDSWKVKRNITLNYGLRWDNYGNPYSRTPSTVFGNFIPGAGTSLQDQIANGAVVTHHHALNRSITDVFSPRAGIAYSPDSSNKWLIKAGAGIFHNWPTLANLQEEYRGNPPGNIFPVFYGGQNPAPVFGLGTTNNKPFGYAAPPLPARTLTSKGGIEGLQFSIGGIDANLKSPIAYIYSAALEREVAHNVVASVAYSGTRGTKLLSGGGQVYNVSYGQDINVFEGDLVQSGGTVPKRLNSSFGSVYYTQNDRESGYNALIAGIRGRFAQTFFNVSYTHSSSMDDTQVLPTYTNPHRWYGPSNWDAPNRLSAVVNYEVPAVNQGLGFTGRLLSGWSTNGTVVLQSGNPLNVYTSASFANGGDYNGDGDNFDFPNVTTYKQDTSRQAFLKTGSLATANFTAPTPGTDGNENFNQFRTPGFQQLDASFLKSTTIAESVNFQMRFEFFNIFNHPNLGGVVTDLSNGNFGKATAQGPPRFFQLGGNLIF